MTPPGLDYAAILYSFPFFWFYRLIYSAGFSPSAAGASSFFSAGACSGAVSASDEVHKVYI